MCGLEEWKWVVGYEGLYKVSNLGRVRSVDRVVRHSRGGPKKLKGKILSAAQNNRFGRLTVSLWKEGIGLSVHVHQIVAEAWIGSCPDNKEVRHGSNGCTDNSVSNLSYSSHHENSLDRRRDNTHCGKAVRRSDGIEFINMHVAAEESDCKVQSIWAVCNGKQKTTGGYGWKYI